METSSGANEKKSSESLSRLPKEIEVATTGNGERQQVDVLSSATTSESVKEVSKERIVRKIPKKALRVSVPDALRILAGQQGLIEKDLRKEHLREPLFLVSAHSCYGIVEFFEEKEGRNTQVLEEYIPPYDVKVLESGTFLPLSAVLFLDPASLSLLDLLDLSQEDLGEELNGEVLLELAKRGVRDSGLYNLIRGWISDYDTSKPNDKQLGDDWRIVLGWYSSLKSGKKLFKKVGEEKKEITEEDCKGLALKIFREMVKRKFTFNSPSTYKRHAGELFRWIIKEEGVDNVPFKEGAKELAIDPSKVKREDLEGIDDVYISGLSDGQLQSLHTRLHTLLKEIGSVTEPLENAHIFVWKELRHRKLKHEIGDLLDRKAALEVVEYPKPEYGEPQRTLSEEMARTLGLPEVLETFPDVIAVDEPVHVFLCGRIVNEEQIPLSHDIDVLFKQEVPHQPSMKAFLETISGIDPKVAERFHFVWDPHGPQIGYTVPLYRLAFLKVDKEEMRKTSPWEFLAGLSPSLLRPHMGLKPASGFKKNEFWDVQELWEKWAKDYIDRGIVVQKKYDGMRFQIHVKGSEVKIFTEDRRRDRAEVFKKSVEELLKHKKVESFIADAEMVEYTCKVETKNLEEVCQQYDREEMIKWIAAGQAKLDDEKVCFHIHDCVMYNGNAINGEGYLERWKTIDKLFPDNLVHWKNVPGGVVHDMKRFFSLVRQYRSMNGSEGVVCKATDSTYKIKYAGEARTKEWAKLKNLKEIDVMVWKVVQKKSKAGKLLPQYLYECLFSIPCAGTDKYREKDLVKRNGKCYLWIGRTYATAEKVSPGTIIVVRPIRVGEYKDKANKLYYTWMFPFYDGKHAAKSEPDSIDVVKKLVVSGTGPMKAQMAKTTIELLKCPFSSDKKLCVLKERFMEPMDSLSERIIVEQLKYPILCKFANHYKCRYVKPYYYGKQEYRLTSYVNEDDAEAVSEDKVEESQ